MQQEGKVPFFTSLYRSQITSVTATGVDFLVYFILFKGLQMYYGWASGIGAFCGAMVSFFLGRNWTFKRKDGKISGQMIRYGLTALASVALNTKGVIYVTEVFNFAPTVSKIIISVLVGVLFNFTMHRYFVYK